MKQIQRNLTRAVKIGTITIGNNNPIAVQSMTSTHTQDVNSTIAQIRNLEEAGADIIRIAVDNERDIDALARIRAETRANLAVDIQEHYRLVKLVASYVNKIRYNPGHLYHHEKEKPWQDKVKFIAEVAAQHSCALRVGVNCGSVDRSIKEKYSPYDTISPMLESAFNHCTLLDNIGFSRYCISLKDSDPYKVIELNKRFADQRPDVPLHLGVTEAGMPEQGIIKTRVALEQLISQGIGDTIRASLTLPNNLKQEEIKIGRQILEDIAAGRVRSVVKYNLEGLNLISCPGCSRVENSSYIELAKEVAEITKYAAKYRITIAIMGCRVNGPGETDQADLGLWCGQHYVNLKRGKTNLGSYSYNEILPRLKQELDKMITEKDNQHQPFYTKTTIT